MTMYFDQKATEFSDLRNAGRCPEDKEVMAFVETLIRDMTLVCEFDKGGPFEFPADLRDKIYTLILRKSISHWPNNLRGWGVDYEHNVQGMGLIEEMILYLHSIFHEAAYAGWEGRDSPMAPVGEMASRRVDRSCELIAANPSLDLSI